MGKIHGLGKAGISVVQFLRNSDVLSTQYKELDDRAKRQEIKSDFEDMYIYSPTGGNSGEVLVGRIAKVQFGIVDDFVLRVKSYRLDQKNKFSDNGIVTLKKEDALKGRLYESKSDLLRYVLDEIKNKGITLGSFHLTHLGILNHLHELLVAYFPNADFSATVNDVIGFLTREKQNLRDAENREIQDNTIKSIMNISLRIIYDDRVSKPYRYLFMDFSTHAVSLLMGSRYREIMKKSV